MTNFYLAVLIFLNLQLHSGYQQTQDSTRIIDDATKTKTNEIETSTDPNLLKLDGFHTLDNRLFEHRDYFLPQPYPHHDDDELDESLYPDYDYDTKAQYGGDGRETSTLKPAPNYVLFDDDIPLQTSKDSLPIFLLEPENTFIIKNKPATLKCRAAKALEVYFKCNGIRTQTTNFEFVDPHTGVRIVEGEYNVSREHVEEYFGKDKFSCSCFAWTGRGQIRSQPVSVELAYIKKQFLGPPRAALVEQHAAAKLRCMPPAATPPPQLYWLKNGAPIVADHHVQSNADGDLLISQVTLQDMANYSCVAENVAGKRISDPVLLTVYVNGGWSEWGPWSECACRGLPTAGRRRTRSCTEPRPLNGGQRCSGFAVQSTQDCVHCDIDIYVDIEDELPDSSDLHSGVWSAWSEWSRCDAACLQVRRRRCATGACLGPDHQLVHCTICTTTNTLSPHWPLLTGLAVAVTIFTVMVVLGIRYMKLRTEENSAYVKSKPELCTQLSGFTENKSLPRQPDLTLHNESNSLRITNSIRKQSFTSVNKFRNEHLYEVPKIDNSYMSPLDYESRQRNSVISEIRYEDKLYTDSEHSDSSCFISTGSSHECNSVEISPSLVNNISKESELVNTLNTDRSETAISGTIIKSGGWLQLSKCAISLYFPEDSVEMNSNEKFWLGIIKEDWNRPLLPEGMTQLSPVIKCGPHHARLRKPIILQFPHCAMLKNSNWIISVLEQKQNSANNPVQWTQVLTLGEKLDNKTMFLHVDSDKVYLMTESLSNFVLVGKSFSGYDIKLLKIAVFAVDPNQTTDYCLRVYIFEDTLCSLYYCLENERKLGGQLIDNPKTMSCQDGCSDLCFSLEEVGLGWKVRPGFAYQEIPFSHVWNANLNSLHCRFTLEQTDSINCLEFKIVVYQKKCPSNRQVFYMRPHENLLNLNRPTLSKQISRLSLNSNYFFNILENPMDTRSHGNANLNDYDTTKESSIIDYDKSYASSVDYTSRLRLSKNDKKTLSNLLDNSTCNGNDWRVLAEKLGFEKSFEYFSTRNSPTENVLNLWECKTRVSGGLVELATAFRLMERNDCANVIDRCIRTNWI